MTGTSVVKIKKKEILCICRSDTKFNTGTFFSPRDKSVVFETKKPEGLRDGRGKEGKTSEHYNVQ